jgi:hypothetical protein
MLYEKKQWTQIGPEYNCIPWKVASKVELNSKELNSKELNSDETKSQLEMIINNVFILHYFNKQKAWQMQRGEWPDIKIWYNVWDSACETYPVITKKLNNL